MKNEDDAQNKPIDPKRVADLLGAVPASAETIERLKSLKPVGPAHHRGSHQQPPEEAPKD